MPRSQGQIDPRKSEAILEAAAALFAERGGSVSMDEIARRAGVSKQTLYNRYASKIEISRAVANRRSEAITAPLRTDGDPETVLAAFAAALMERLAHPAKDAHLRIVALMSPSAPDLALAIYESGPQQSLRRLSDWLSEQTRLGRLLTPDPDDAAEMFVGMALGHSHLRSMLGVEHPLIDIPARATEVAQRFIRAFAR